mmetsp:Transcript_7915/g.13698  ORF Transcript_7915/g.13698 Transcript_7915/m.13698 type:complete len:222 (-) Transcript_7915:1134-1799(-)
MSHIYYTYHIYIAFAVFFTLTSCVHVHQSHIRRRLHLFTTHTPILLLFLLSCISNSPAGPSFCPSGPSLDTSGPSSGPFERLRRHLLTSKHPSSLHTLFSTVCRTYAHNTLRMPHTALALRACTRGSPCTHKCKHHTSLGVSISVSVSVCPCCLDRLVKTGLWVSFLLNASAERAHADLCAHLVALASIYIHSLTYMGCAHTLARAYSEDASCPPRLRPQW